MRITHSTIKALCFMLLSLSCIQAMESQTLPCEPDTGPYLLPFKDDLTSNRFDGLPANRLQVALFYDGEPATLATLKIQVLDTISGSLAWLSLQATVFSDRVATGEFDMNGIEPTGVFHVDGVVPNGVVDGLAFGILYKDSNRRYHHVQSGTNDGSSRTMHVGAWPLAGTLIMPQVSDANGRAQARTVLFGARLMENGCHYLPILPGDCPGPITSPPSCDSGTTTYQPITSDLTSNRFDAMPNNTLQMVLFYDGNNTATLRCQVWDTLNGVYAWLRVEARNFFIETATAEFDISDLQLTGNFVVEDVVANGVVEGIAFGLYWKDDQGRLSHFQSQNENPVARNDFVGIWPVGWPLLVPQVSDSNAQQQARMTVTGAQLLPNGCHFLPLQWESCPVVFDNDGDGVPNDEDLCPDSDTSATVVVNGCNSGVDNLVLPDGCTISDLIAECAGSASNHGNFVSCVAVSTTCSTISRERVSSKVATKARLYPVPALDPQDSD